MNETTRQLEFHADYLQRLKTELIARYSPDDHEREIVPSAIFYRDGQMLAHVMFAAQNITDLNQALSILTLGYNADMVISIAESWTSDLKCDPITKLPWDRPGANALDDLALDHDGHRKGWCKPALMAAVATATEVVMSLRPFYVVPDGITYGRELRWCDTEPGTPYSPVLRNFRVLMDLAQTDTGLPPDLQKHAAAAETLFPGRWRDVRDAIFTKAVTKSFPGLQLALSMDLSRETERQAIFNAFMSEAGFVMETVEPDRIDHASHTLYPDQVHAEPHHRGKMN